MFFKGKEIVGKSNKQEIIIECDCATHFLKIDSFDDDNDVYIEIWTSNFISKQKNRIYKRIFDRLKLIWYAIIGKEYLLEDFIISSDEAKQVSEALNEIIANKKTK